MSEVLLWLTDRSRYELGLKTCPRARLLSNHFGPNGYGIARKAQSFPLATGTAVHSAADPILKWIKAEDQLPPDGIVRAAIAGAKATYLESVETRGFLFDPDQPEVKVRLAEETALLEGLTWCWVLGWLPIWLEEWRPFAVEEEQLHLMSCTCGAGHAPVQTHIERGCTGVANQVRVDCLWQHRSAPDRYAYMELKTTGWSSSTWREQWETAMQFAVGVKAYEQYYGISIGENWVLGLDKGMRKGEYNPESGDYDGPKRQQSVLCYGYRRPENPPTEPESWRPQFKYLGDDGKKHTLGRNYKKASVWEIPEEWRRDPSQGPASADTPDVAYAMSAVEYWVRSFSPELQRAQLLLVGPLNPQREIIDAVSRQWVYHEREWQKKLEESYTVLEACGWDWTQKDYQHVLDRLFPQSWACDRYGRRNRCQFAPICLKEEGWQDPLGSGQYVLRTPHHQFEVDQMKQRGVELPPDMGEQDVFGEGE